MSSEEGEKTTIEFSAFNSLSLSVPWIIINTTRYNTADIILIYWWLLELVIRYGKSLYLGTNYTELRLQNVVTISTNNIGIN